MSKILIQIIEQQTEIMLNNVEATLESVSDEQLRNQTTAMPLWKHFYHMLHSLDQWFINPFDYQEPDFHKKGMNSLDQNTPESLSKAELQSYLGRIRIKIITYLNQIQDDSLAEDIGKSGFSRLGLILAQSRHLMYHIGLIHSILFQETGAYPEFIGISEAVNP